MSNPLAHHLAGSIISDLEDLAEELARESGLSVADSFSLVFHEFLRQDRESGDGLLAAFVDVRLRISSSKDVRDVIIR